MCTVTWLQQPGGYELYFNRDEKSERAPGEAPRTLQQQGVDYIAPLDGESGGTWIGVNQAGVTHCLLNYYDNDEQEELPKQESRGLLVTSLMDILSPSDLAQRITAEVAATYPPFITLSVFPGVEVRSVTWTGKELTSRSLSERELPITTSSFDTERVVEERKDHYAACLKKIGDVNADMLRDYHASHEPTLSAYSVCMHREEAETVSLTRIQVSEREVLMQYFPGSPCKWTQDAQVEARLLIKQSADSAPQT